MTDSEYVLAVAYFRPNKLLLYIAFQSRLDSASERGGNTTVTILQLSYTIQLRYATVTTVAIQQLLYYRVAPR